MCPSRLLLIYSSSYCCRVLKLAWKLVIQGESVLLCFWQQICTCIDTHLPIKLPICMCIYMWLYTYYPVRVLPYVCMYPSILLQPVQPQLLVKSPRCLNSKVWPVRQSKLKKGSVKDLTDVTIKNPWKFTVWWLNHHLYKTSNVGRPSHTCSDQPPEPRFQVHRSENMPLTSGWINSGLWSI